MNKLSKDKQIQVISALVEGSSIRSVERMTGIHRDTIMRLGVQIGNQCEKWLKQTMVNLNCSKIEVDEIWGFIGKKQKNTNDEEKAQGLGHAWTYIALDPDSKAVPCFKVVSDRDREMTTEFIRDLASRLNHRIQLSSDSLKPYIYAIEDEFGNNIDYGQVVKTYIQKRHKIAPYGKGRYSPGHVVSISKTALIGEPDMKLVCTSHIERQNLTVRMHCKRLARLTNAFSKKLVNFKAAMGLHFAYYNFVKIHTSIKQTPAVALGVANEAWTVGDLVDLNG